MLVCSDKQELILAILGSRPVDFEKLNTSEQPNCTGPLRLIPAYSLIAIFPQSILKIKQKVTQWKITFCRKHRQREFSSLIAV